MGQITVVTSGKGGAGKSTVTVGLGLALAGAGGKVLLIDGDAGLRSLDLMLGIGQQVVFDLSDIFAGNCEPIRAVYPSAFHSRLSLLPAPLTPERLCSPADMRRLCRGFAQHYDFVLLDSPAGTGAGFETVVAAADSALVVTTPDPVCARDAQLVGERLTALDKKCRLIINRLRPSAVRRGKMPDIDEIIDMAGIQLIGVIPEDEQITLAGAAGQPFPKKGVADTCFRNIARRFCGDNVPLLDL